ncbi:MULTISPECIES: PEP-CTERM sorting domain-containing protein [unclassified Lentimonas]|uniref:PEP-CTERM sorting domain-containing protein n=1 Tax=unclassified Lentimonas TaxID=2630993 RepID=UPI0013216AE8|nr:MULTISPECIES: PEP-CTERM sorting domain-containing protein [unclassified Lentimonas]CAA6692159.1 Unannotated [Lentimonas sp. CC19]CAA6697021.1 Unannotated [Lentimonas sp. CC10]CAA7070592.1 Unannotated [Lentimonas sp. CC11]
MNKKTLAFSGVAILAASLTSQAAITADVVGDGTNYDILGTTNATDALTNQANSYRSTGVTKTFDVGVNDNVYGTDGVFMFGNGLVADNGRPYSLHTQVGASFATFSAGANFSSVAADATQGPMDDPTLTPGTTVADWGVVGFGTKADTGNAGAWGEVLEFTFDASTPQQFRIGLFAGTQSAADGRWDPTGIRLTDGSGNVLTDGVDDATVGGLVNNTNGAPNIVFFDIDLDGALSGTFGIEISQRNASQGGSLTGVTFDVIPEPSSYALLAGCLALTSVMLRRRRA